MPKIQVVLVEPESSFNVGMIARAMKNFGFHDLRLVSPMFESFERAYILAMHAKDVLSKARIFYSLQEAVSKSDVVIGTTAKASFGSIGRRAVFLRDYVQELRWDATYSLVFGRESTGLTNEELNICDVIITIPTSEEYPTLNLSNAVAIVLYEFFISLNRDRVLLKPVGRRIRNELLDVFSGIIDLTDLPKHKRKRAKALLRRLMERMYPCGMTSDEATYLLGAFRAIRRKLEG